VVLSVLTIGLASRYTTINYGFLNLLSCPAATDIVVVQYEQLNDLKVKFESSLERQDDLHAKFDLSFTSDNLKVAALQAEEQAETVAEQFLSGICTGFC